MKFAVLNSNQMVERVLPSVQDAETFRNENTEPGDEWAIMPIMTLEEFAATSKDFAGYTTGRPSVLYFDPKHGTVLGNVYLIGSWDDYQLWSGKRFRDYLMPDPVLAEQ